MHILRWRDGLREYELTARRQDGGPERGWVVLHIQSEFHANNLLASCNDTHRLRDLLSHELITPIGHLDDWQVKACLTQLLLERRFSLRVKETAEPVVEAADSVARTGASPMNRLRSSSARTTADIPLRISPRSWASKQRTTPRVAGKDSPVGSPLTASSANRRYWIEIQLLGEDDHPIPDIEYRLELPDKQIVTGRLDSNGLARCDNLLRDGDCRICFPQLDKDAWSFIRTEAA